MADVARRQATYQNGTREGDAKARIRPFDAIELDLGVLRASVVLKPQR